MRHCFFGCNLDVGSAPPESRLATGNAIGSEFSELRAIIDHIQNKSYLWSVKGYLVPAQGPQMQVVFSNVVV